MSPPSMTATSSPLRPLSASVRSADRPGAPAQVQATSRWSSCARSQASSAGRCSIISMRCSTTTRATSGRALSTSTPPTAEGPSTPALRRPSQRRSWFCISSVVNTCRSSSSFQPPMVNSSTSTGMGTVRTRVITSRFVRASCSFAARFSRNFGVSSSKCEKIPSRSP